MKSIDLITSIMCINKNKSLAFLIYVFVTLVSCDTKRQVVDTENVKTEDNTVVLSEGQYKTADIKLGKIEQRTLKGILKVNGNLDVPPQNMISVSAPLGGFLQSTEMLQGRSVKKGECIAIIRNSEYIQLQQDYLDAKSQLEFLNEEYKRQEELAKENVNAQKTLQQAKASYFSKLATLNGLHAKLEMLNIDFKSLENGQITSTINLYSPINGFITEVNYNIGSFLNATDVLFKIVDTNHLHAEVTVFEKDIAKVKKGQKIRFTLTGNNEEKLATVYLIGKEISADRTVRIHGHLDKEDHDLLPGMYLNATIEVDHNPVDALPEKAIVNFEGKPYVFVAEGGNRFNMVEITTGVSESGYTEVILPGNFDKLGANIVLNGTYNLLSKLKNTEEE